MAVLKTGLLLSLALCATLLAWSGARAQGSTLEYAVKANYLYKFGPFVEWPAEGFAGPSSPFVVCVMGEDPFGAVLDQAVRGQAVHGRTVIVRRPTNAVGAGGCHVLYLGRLRGQNPADVLRALREQPVLTVTDSAVGGPHGVVHFVLKSGRVRFSVDEQAASAAKLSISSKLLALSVEDGR
jgi:hypothetical protein